MKRALVLLATIAALGCEPADQSHRMGATPPPGRVIGFDPSVVGLPAAIDTTVYDSAGVISWVKYGTSNTAWRPVPVSQFVTSDPSQSPGLKAPIGFKVTKTDGTASWTKSTSSDTGWATTPSAVATSTTAGLMSTLAAPLNVSLPVIAFQSDVLDLTQTQTVQMGVAIPGFYASAFTARLIITSGTGSCTTGPTFTVGNNAAKTNLCLSSAISTTNINAAITAGAGIMSGLIPTNASSLPYVDLTTPVSGVITVAAVGTGGFALHGRLQVVFVLSPMPQ